MQSAVPHVIKAADCKKQKNVRIEKYMKKWIDETPFEKGLNRLGSHAKKSLVIKFNTAYYAAKNEKPFSDFPNLLELQEKMEWETLGRLSYWHEMCWISK